MKNIGLVLSVVLLSACAFAQLTPEAVVEQNAKLQTSITALTSTNTQIDQFTALLTGAQETMSEAHHTDLITRGTTLVTQWNGKDGIVAARIKYTAEVARHDAACPDSTEDPALQASCNKWKANLDIILGRVQARIKTWSASKDALYADMKDYDAAPAAVHNDQFTIQNLERAKARILGDLGQINDDVLKCRQAITNSTEEDMVEKCGQMWDGNAIHPGLVNQGTGTKTYGTGANPTTNQQQN
jgi:hypothetical protein